ncbi:hypothetical protein [Promicromonospora sukumoe]|uniref:hypothetical protein n=1 Tax=Promicromonospora sukumoe TaxID=88382 RepID=UPI001E284557|nr:hypothetical protein [Promicromonospora sukumoe]
MATRHLYLARHGAADAFGELTTSAARRPACSANGSRGSPSPPSGTRPCRAPPRARA